MVVRPGSEGSLVTPARALGLIYLPLDRTDRQLTVSLEAPQRIQPNTTINVKVKAPEAKGQMAFVTLSAVDAKRDPEHHAIRIAGPARILRQISPWRDLHDVYGRLIENVGQKGQPGFGGATPTLPRVAEDRATSDLFSGPIPLTQMKRKSPARTDFNERCGSWRSLRPPTALVQGREMTIAAPLITELATPVSFETAARRSIFRTFRQSTDLQNLTEWRWRSDPGFRAA
jgi:hypothetical protein